jgi:flagellar basal-body rod protein FlgF
MDRLIYTAASGAKHIMEQQATTSNNLANLSTTGFRAQFDTFRAVPVQSEGLPTRAFVVDNTVGADFSSGALQVTGRDLDVAVKGKGWIAVQNADGTESYTRNGSLQLSPNGILQTSNGQTIAGEGGPITIPPDDHGQRRHRRHHLDAVDHHHAGRAHGAGPHQAGEPERSRPGARRRRPVPPEGRQQRPGRPAVTVAGGALEGSNVSAVDAMVNMISLGRSFETQMSLLKNAENNATKATQILALT